MVLRVALLMPGLLPAPGSDGASRWHAADPCCYRSFEATIVPVKGNGFVWGRWATGRQGIVLTHSTLARPHPTTPNSSFHLAGDSLLSPLPLPIGK
jgi:hypothetical protein